MGKGQNLRTRIITGNWKLNKTVNEAIEHVSVLKGLISDTTGVEVVLAPPFTVLAAVAAELEGSSISLSAQDMFWEHSGAFTGEISPVMLKDVGCEYVIVGHSERRQYFGETNETVNKKVQAAHAHNLKPIICVGESLKDRKAGRTEAVIKEDVAHGITGLSELAMRSTVIAYEPVWAIGTGVTATPQQVQEAHEFIIVGHGKIFYWRGGRGSYSVWWKR